MRKHILPAALAVLTALSFPLYANDLVSETRNAQQEEAAKNTEREMAFATQERQLRETLEKLEAQRAQLNDETELLSARLSENEQQLAALEETRRLESGSLGDVFDVIRAAGKDIAEIRKDSPASALQPSMDEALNALLDPRGLPTLPELNQFELGLAKMLQNSAAIEAMPMTVRDDNGDISTQTVTRIGDLALVGDAGFLEWDSQHQQANQLPEISSRTLTQGVLSQLSVMDSVTLDPTRGELLKHKANAPKLSDRLAQGGVVGGVIIVLLLVGLGISVIRGVTLFSVGRKMEAQVNAPEGPADNPLGRVLSVYQSEPDRSLETLELRLLETVMDEQEQFEKGLSMLKLLAALAPMLGLLGTVTGMIETFQVITDYGSGNPSIMAGGISTALVTTVMGLIAAIPLLLAHNVLSSKADALKNMLEKTGVGLIAQQAEADALRHPGKRND